jgi:hypothetical protein
VTSTEIFPVLPIDNRNEELAESYDQKGSASPGYDLFVCFIPWVRYLDEVVSVRAFFLMGVLD